MSTQQLQEIESYVIETARGYGTTSGDPRPESLLGRDLGFDELDTIEFVMDIEDRFSIAFDDDFEPSECEDLTLQKLITMTAQALGLIDEVAP